MPQCPKCRSFNVAHKEKQLHELDHKAKHLVGHSVSHVNPAMFAVVTGGYLIGRAVHALSPTYTCLNPSCGNRFS